MEALPHSGQNTPQVPLLVPVSCGLMWQRSIGLMNSLQMVDRRLSRRELRWRRSLADGLTKRQIAERLLISERTADGHPEHPSSVAAAGRRSPAGS